ncbi:hypothetical protein, partial [Eisenbergiella massiliensis]|uniref:hypothetical protein n=1 Tax=Eisenbergiella massiliensis TaxID=1720294 RepID=UPI0023F2D39E
FYVIHIFSLSPTLSSRQLNQNLGSLLSTWDYLTDSIAGKGTATTESITLSRPLSRYKFLCIEFEVEKNLPNYRAYMYGNLIPVSKMTLGKIKWALAYNNAWSSIRIEKLSDSSVSVTHEYKNYEGGIAYRIIGIS